MALEGLRCKMVVRRETSKEKLDCLRAMGVELILVDGSLPPDSPESYNRKARQVAAETSAFTFDLAKGTVTLKGPQGNSQTIKARNPANLKKVKVGDLVDITYTELLGLKVEEAPK
jgi:cysteine synthase